MTDFNNINPDKNLRTNFNSNRQGQGAPQEKPEAPEEAAPAVDPYADLKMDPGEIMKLLSAQAKLNAPLDAQHAGIGKAMSGFAREVSPERHARACRIIEQAYIQEFGKPPVPELLQEMVDDYLIGQPVIQAS